MLRHLLLVLAALPLAAQAPTALATRVEARLRAELEAQRSERHFPGAGCAFVLPDGSIGAIAVGSEDLAGKTPLTTKGKLFSGSIGKTYVAALALQLVGEGKLDLDAKVETVLGQQPWFAKLPNHDVIALRHLLTHTSGIPEYCWKPGFEEQLLAAPDRLFSPLECLGFILGDPPLSEPAAKWSYADANYLVVGLMLEQVTGKPYYTLLQERVLTPLHLDDTLPSSRRDLAGLANGHRSGIGFGKGDTVVDGRYFVHPGFEWCGGGLCCTTRDLARWCRELFAGEVIPKALRVQHVTGVVAQKRVTELYGLGCFVMTSPHGKAFGHSGFMPGYLSMMTYYPGHRLAMALQCNTDDPRQAGDLRRHVDRLAGLVLEEVAAAKK
jgi:D-alanyl-D-alanine carboxypeptidase